LGNITLCCIVDSSACLYHDRIAFTVVNVCGIYYRHFFRKELVVDKDQQVRFDVYERLAWIAEYTEIRDVLIIGGDPLLLFKERKSDNKSRSRCGPRNRFPVS
jgi:lysine 2,3-aminomutase